MALNIEDNGNNNIINIDKDVPNNFNLKIIINGNNNKIIIGNNTVFHGNSYIKMNNHNNLLEIGENSLIKAKIDFLGSKNSLIIGDRTKIGEASFSIAEQQVVKIGTDCLISWDVWFRTSDNHSIIDIETNKRINGPASIFVGNNVWIAASSWFLKGSQVSNGSIVATRSLITKSFNEENSLIAGNPAKMIKKGVAWDEKLLPYEVEKNDNYLDEEFTKEYKDKWQ